MIVIVIRLLTGEATLATIFHETVQICPYLNNIYSSISCGLNKVFGRQLFVYFRSTFDSKQHKLTSANRLVFDYGCLRHLTANIGSLI